MMLQQQSRLVLVPACPPASKVFSGGRCDRRSRRQCLATASGQGVQSSDSSTEAAGEIDRRRLFLCSLSAAALASCTVTSPARAAPYTDERDNYTIQIPEGWSQSEGKNAPGTGPTATRRTLAWFEPSNPSSYVTVVVTNVGADYTSLGSFGTAEQFGSNLVGGMDQSFLKRAPKWAVKQGQVPQEARLIKASEGDRAYNIEYTIKRTEEDQRHLLSTVAIGYNGRYTRLYTVTAQCAEDKLQKEKPILQDILTSFRAPYPRN